ncbi:hypothetical protein [Pseudoalteromonas sp. OOF1S-7]|uniref:hypothetical protein n=1 Tax=Pseudoalteromonas sp. OOF1S-7 TaxID=2917757 RepID=UPI001EF744BC|nr:hypothetical protein [Pseudoalteromonas sp. OOF1S-7]MCG7537940.1 hypothetical protein [Pseudoalteromonas sp. OOF1S-7]
MYSRKFITLMLSTSFLVSFNVSAEDFEASFLNGLFKYLAERRNMNLISYHGEKVAEIGRLYYVEKPLSAPELQEWAERGKDIQLFELSKGYDFSSLIEWQKGVSYQIQETLAGHLSAELEATLKKRGIKASTFIAALRKSRIRFTVYRKVVGGLDVSKEVNKDKAKLITEFNDFGMGEGMVIPFQQLVVADFTYSSQSSAELQALLGFDLLSNVKAQLSSGVVRDKQTNLTYPASTTIAFKAFPVYFKEQKWFAKW